MINFYEAWKEDKEREPRNTRSKKQYRCKLCSKRVNGLKHHVEHVHGAGSWKRYLQAEQEIRDSEFKAAFYRL